MPEDEKDLIPASTTRETALARIGRFQIVDLGGRPAAADARSRWPAEPEPARLVAELPRRAPELAADPPDRLTGRVGLAQDFDLGRGPTPRRQPEPAALGADLLAPHAEPAAARADRFARPVGRDQVVDLGRGPDP